MAVTNWLSPTATGEDHNNWTDPTNAYTDDTSRATTPTTTSLTTLGVQVSYDGGTTYPNTSTYQAFANFPTSVGEEAYETVGSSSTFPNGMSAPSRTNLLDTNFRMRLAQETTGSVFVVADSQDYYNFAFDGAIPTGATIDGAEIAVKGYSSGSLGSWVWNVNHVRMRVYYTPSSGRTLISSSRTVASRNLASRSLASTRSSV